MILTEAISFFLCCAHCHRIDVVSGCGKNAEGAVQTLSLVFHNLTKTLTLVLPKFYVLVAVHICYFHKDIKPYVFCPFLDTHNILPPISLLLHEGPQSHDRCVIVLLC